MKSITVITCFIFALVGGWIFLAVHYFERTFPLYPLIDTKLPPGFSEAEFARIQVGMSKAEVLKILPTPVPRIEYNEKWSIDDNSWYYGQDNAAAPFGDFAWFEFVVHFNEEGRVEGKQHDVLLN